MPLNIDDRLELWYGPLKGKARHDRAVAMMRARPYFGFEDNARYAVLRSIFLSEYADHALTSLEKDRIDWAQRRGEAIDLQSVALHVYEWGVFGRAPSWIGKWKDPVLDDLAFDCWCRRTYEVSIGFKDQSQFPQPIEEWISWFSIQLLKKRNGEPYETSFQGMALVKEGPKPLPLPADQFMDEVPI